jgi:hypothetical protein
MSETLNISTLPRHRLGQPLARGLMALGLAGGVWALSVGMSPAQARDDVYWSVGVQSPGVQVGVSNAPPAPVYVQRPRPRPIYVQPAPVVVYPAPVYYGQPSRIVYVDQWAVPIGRDYDHRGRRGKHRGHGHGHDRDDDWGYGRGR